MPSCTPISVMGEGCSRSWRSTPPGYGRGGNVRDWIHVDAHARALVMILTRGRVGEKYNVGARAERSNLAVVKALCEALDRHCRAPGRASHHDLVTFVTDRPG